MIAALAPAQVELPIDRQSCPCYSNERSTPTSKDRIHREEISAYRCNDHCKCEAQELVYHMSLTSKRQRGVSCDQIRESEEGSRRDCRSDIALLAGLGREILIISLQHRLLGHNSPRSHLDLILYRSSDCVFCEQDEQEGGRGRTSGAVR
jgi:hypothetical protein